MIVEWPTVERTLVEELADEKTLAEGSVAQKTSIRK